MFAAVADQQDPPVVELLTAVGAAPEALVGVVGVEDRPRIPVGTLDHPGNDVLEAAEDRLALTDRLRCPEALALGNVDPTPAART
jgi:hypothetical protein